MSSLKIGQENKKIRQEYRRDKIYVQHSLSWVLETTTQKAEGIGRQMNTSRLPMRTQEVR